MKRYEIKTSERGIAISLAWINEWLQEHDIDGTVEVLFSDRQEDLIETELVLLCCAMVDFLCTSTRLQNPDVILLSPMMTLVKFREADFLRFLEARGFLYRIKEDGAPFKEFCASVVRQLHFVTAQEFYPIFRYYPELDRIFPELNKDEEDVCTVTVCSIEEEGLGWREYIASINPDGFRIENIRDFNHRRLEYIARS